MSIFGSDNCNVDVDIRFLLLFEFSCTEIFYYGCGRKGEKKKELVVNVHDKEV